MKEDNNQIQNAETGGGKTLQLSAIHGEGGSALGCGEAAILPSGQ